jgi:thiamine kinase-like enzyme
MGVVEIMHDADLAAILATAPELFGDAPRICPLSGGITNRNFRVDSAAGSFVVRLAGADSELLGIDRTHEHACSVVAATVGVGAEVVAYLPARRALVTRFVAGKTLTAEDARDHGAMRRIVTSLRRLHDGPSVPGFFSPFATVRSYHVVCRDRNVDLPASLPVALETMARIEQALGAKDQLSPCHNDLLPANFIDDGDRVVIVDWEYAGMGDRFFDLGNLAVNCQLGPKDEELLLNLYFGDVQPEQMRRLRLMRLASDLREAMWGFVQAGISTLDFDFVAYGRDHLDRFLAASAEADRLLATDTA